MRVLRILAGYILLVLLGGGLLAPWLYWSGQWAAHELPGFERLAAASFSKYVSRAAEFLALFGLVWLLPAVGLGSWRSWWRGGARQSLRRALDGALLGWFSLAIVAGLALGFGARRWDISLSAGEVMRASLGAALAAVVVALMEEIVFRGGLFGAMKREWPLGWAILGSSAVYALVHFLETPEWKAPVGPWSGLGALPHMMAGFGNLTKLIPGFLNLTLAGALLALAFARFGTLYFSIGLHAGWIFWLKWYGIVTDQAAGKNDWLWGTRKLVDGWVVFPILAILTAFFWFRRRTTDALDDAKQPTDRSGGFEKLA